MGFVDIPFDDDEDRLADAAFAYLMANLAGWVPSDGHVDTWLIQTFVRITMFRTRVDAKVSAAIFREYGRKLIGLAPVDSASAIASTTWTATNDDGYTIPAGTQVAYRAAGDVLVPFVVDAAVTIPPGSTATTAGEVQIRALDAGEDGNGFTGAVQLLDTLDFVASIATVGSSAGGVDGESDAAYLDRLVEELQLISPRPILPADFAVMARRVPGVHRALAIDGYNPDDLTTGNERMVAVAVVDADGAPLSSGVKDDVEALLEARREVNFVVNAMDPTVTAIDVTATLTALTGYDTAAVDSAVTAAITDYLSSASWGGGDEQPPTWRLDTVVRYFDIVALIENVAGVDHLDTLTVDGGTANVTLTGPAPLTEPGTIAVTVT